MAKTETRARKRLGSSSCFLDCFGFSREIYSEKQMAAVEDGGEKKMKKSKNRSRWFLCTKFRLKDRKIKPSPVKETEKPTSRVEDETDKPSKPLPVIRHMTDRKNIAFDDKAVNQETEETKPNDLLEDITADRSKPLEPLGSFTKETCPARMSNSTSYGKPELKQNRARSGSRVKKFDPVIGISIIILTLMIMLIWGRLCAILCTSAWCYFLPRLRDAAALAKLNRSGSDGSAAFVPDLKSELYKRKVVFDEFLGRHLS